MISIRPFRTYPGSAASFLAFDASFLLLIALALPRPRIFTYTFLAAFLFLGFWVKFMAHMWVTYPFVEAVGRFKGSSSEWSASLWFACAGAWGISLARVFHLLVCSTKKLAPVGDLKIQIPGWYARHRRAVWILFFSGDLILCVLNWRLSIYKIGIASTANLPLHGNAAGAWLMTLGGAMVLAVLVEWELRLATSAALPLLAVVVEACTATVSMLSRSAYLFRVVPYGLVLFRSAKSPARSKAWKVFVLSSVTGFALSLVAVSILRIRAYPLDVLDKETAAPAGSSVGTTPGRAPIETPVGKVTKVRAARTVLGLRKLPIDRWVGLEGVLAVTASGETGSRLLKIALAEDPKRGTQSLYQEIAQPGYQRSSQFVFLTLPGLIGFLAYSGSLWFTVLGSFVITVGALGIEELINRGLRSPLLSALVAANLAYRIVQLTYPYLLGVFVLELLVQSLLMWAVIRLPSRVSMSLRRSAA
jgi:ABC-type multidrug transport system fused ATPase/permease subunit